MSQTAELAAPPGTAPGPKWTSKQIVIMLVIGVGALLVSLTQSLLVPVLPELAVNLHTNGDGVAWILTATLLVSAVAVPAYGRLGDLFGTRKMLVLSQGGSWGWGSARIVGLFVAAVVLLVVFVLAELRIKSPLVDVRTTARPALLLTNIASLCVGFALFATLIGTASYVEAPKATGYGFGASILVGGLCMLPGGIGMLIFSPVSAKMKPRTALIVGALIIAAGFLSRIWLTGAIWQIVVGASIAGIGTGIAYAAMPGLIIHATPRSELAAANGLNTLFRSVGSSLASAIGGAILAGVTINLGGFELASLTAYRILFTVCAGAAALGALLALLIPKQVGHGPR
jgi:MFS family permease